MLSRTLKMAFWVMFDHMGKLALANFLSACALAAPIFLAYGAFASGDVRLFAFPGVPCLLLCTVLLLPLSVAGIACMSKELIETKDGQMRTFILGVRRYGWRAIGLGGAFSFAAACLLLNVWFYAAIAGQTHPLLGYLLSATALWGLVFTGATAAFAGPALIQRGQGTVATLKTAALLVLHNPLFSVGVAGMAALCLAASAFPPAFFCASLAPAVVLVTAAYEMLSRKYARLEALDSDSGSPHTGTLAFDDAQDDYLNRGLRDFLFPWKQ